MMYAQYCRIESKAGGCGCTRRQFIRAALSKLKAKARRSRAQREARHLWLLEGLEYHRKSQQLYRTVMRGG